MIDIYVYTLWHFRFSFKINVKNENNGEGY